MESKLEELLMEIDIRLKELDNKNVEKSNLPKKVETFQKELENSLKDEKE